MAQNFFDHEATSKMDEEYSRRMSSLPKTSLEGFSIPKLEKSEAMSINSSVQNKLLNMAMSSGNTLHQSLDQGNVNSDWFENKSQSNQSWSRPAAAPIKTNKKRTFQENSTSKSWANDYDKPIPKSVLDLCLEDECKVCGVQILNFLQRKQHYDGAKHEKKVKLELSDLYANGDEIAPKKRKVDSTDMNACAEMFLKKISNEVSRDTSNLTMKDFQLAAWQKKWLEGWDLPIPPQIISMCRITKCDVCESTFTSVNTAQSHFEGKNHEKKLKVCLEVFCQQNGLETPKKLADTEALSENLCKLCDVALSSPTMARIHYAGKQHKKKVAQCPAAVIKDETGRFGIGEGFVSETNKQKQTENDYMMETLKSAESEDGVDGTWGADQSTEEQRFQSVVNPSISFSYPIKQFNPFFCKICNIDLASKVTYEAHIAGKNHKKKENSMNHTSQGEFYCDVCTLQLTSLVTFEAHIRGKQHAKRVGSAAQPAGPAGQFKCDVCSITTTDQNGLTMHLNGKNHLSKLKRINGSV